MLSSHIKPYWSIYISIAAEIKVFPIQRTNNRTYFDEKFISFASKQHFGWSYCSCWRKVFNNGRVQIYWITKSKAFSIFEKNLMEPVSTLDVHKNILDLDGLECKLKSVYAADFAKQALSIQEVAEINTETWSKPSPGRRSQITASATSASYERSFSSLNCVNNYLRSSKSGEWVRNLVLISMN